MDARSMKVKNDMLERIAEYRNLLIEYYIAKDWEKYNIVKIALKSAYAIVDSIH